MYEAQSDFPPEMDIFRFFFIVVIFRHFVYSFHVSFIVCSFHISFSALFSEWSIEKQVLHSQCKRLEAQNYTLTRTAEQLSLSMGVSASHCLSAETMCLQSGFSQIHVFLSFASGFPFSALYSLL